MLSKETFKTIGEGANSALAGLGGIVLVTCTSGTGGGGGGNAAIKQLKVLFEELDGVLAKILAVVDGATKELPQKPLANTSPKRASRPTLKSPRRK